VRLGSARGEVVVHARLFDGAQPGMVVVESIWPSECYESGGGINALTSDTVVSVRAEAALMPQTWRHSPAMPSPSPIPSALRLGAVASGGVISYDNGTAFPARA
jgi:hypothetical protein